MPVSPPSDPRSAAARQGEGTRRVYLAGPINGCSDAETFDWRRGVAAVLPGVIDPSVRDQRGQPFTEGEAIELCAADKAEIGACHILLAYCWRPSFGTAMEVLYAYDRGKTVVVVHPEFDWQPWLLAHSHRQFRALGEAVAWLRSS